MSKSSRRMNLVIVCLASAGALAPAPAEPRKDVPSLVAEEITVCEQAMEQLDLAVKNAVALKPDDLRLAAWEQRYIKALSLSKMGKAAKIVALEKLVKRAKGYEEMAEAWVKSGQGMQSAALDARFRRLEAEIALAQTKRNEGDSHL